MSELINRDDAEQQIKTAINDYLPEGILQQVLDLIYGDGLFLVTDSIMEEELNEEDDYA